MKISKFPCCTVTPTIIQHPLPKPGKDDPKTPIEPVKPTTPTK